MELLLLGLLAMGILGGNDSKHGKDKEVLAIMSTSTDRGILDP